MQIPINFNPRGYQMSFMAAMDAGCLFAVLCWARRAGKDFTCFGYAVKKMVDTPMNVVLVFPTKQQGYESFWTNVENDGMKTLDHIPKSLIESQTNSPSNMKITLKNGSTFTLIGASEPDALRGANGKLYIFSEFVDLPNEALDVIIPIVEVNGGQIILQSTPKIDGISGGTFKLLFDRAKKLMESGDKTQFASLVTAREYLNDDQLERIRQNTIAKYGNDFWYRQEFLCDWGQASASNYYGEIISKLKDKGRVGIAPYNPLHPVYTVRDMGISDNHALGFWQYYMFEGKLTVFLIDYFEANNTSNEALVAYINAKPYVYAWHFFPHDGSVRDSDLIERIEKHRALGLVNSSLLKREPKEDGIKRVIDGLADSYFNEPLVSKVLDKLILYKRKYNALTGDYEGPEHKTESHAADMIRYLFKAVEQDFDAKTGAFLYAPDQVQTTYESNLVQTPGQYRG